MGKPKIRFRGYTDDWEQRKLSEFGEATGGTSIESEFSADGIYKVISIGSYSEDNIYRDQGIRAVRSDKTINRILNKGDITMILNDKTASGNIIGRVLLIEESGVYVYNQRTERIEVGSENYNSQFIYTMLNAPEIRDKIIKQSQGNTQIYVNWTTVSQTDYLVPQIEEQIKIGEYFKSIDNLITLHQRKCEETKKLKKYMLQKMFPQNGQVVPEIRFSGFTDDWEQRKVSEITTSYSGGTPKAGKAEYYDGDIPFIRSGEIYDKYTELFITQEGMNNSSAKMVSKGDILYALYGATSGEVSRAGLDGAINQAILAILPEEGIDADFLVEWFRNEKANIIDKYLQGGQGNLSAQIIKNLDILIPSFEEQQKMGQYFSELNNLITLHQNKCDELKKIKKFMLQNMFV